MINWKRIKNLFGMIWFTSVLSFGSYLLYQDATVDSSKLVTYTGTVIESGLTEHTSLTSFGPRSSKVFYLKLEGLEEIIATHNVDQEYHELFEMISKGDIITVKYKPSFNKQEPNIDTYQIEKNDKKLLNQSTYRTKRLIGVILAGFGAIALFIYGLRVDRKYWKRKK